MAQHWAATAWGQMRKGQRMDLLLQGRGFLPVPADLHCFWPFWSDSRELDVPDWINFLILW